MHSRCFNCTAEVVARGNLDTTSMSPVHLTDSFLRRQGVAREEFFEPSITHSCELSGGGGVARSLDSQVTCHQ